jgi:dUTP pyrophosphatase
VNVEPDQITPLRLTFRRLHPQAVVPGRAHEGDAACDLSSAEHANLGPGNRALVGTGIAVAIPTGCAGLVLPRSGLAVKHGVSLVNAPGLIDPGYRGEIRVPLINHDPREDFEVQPGMRVAQLLVVRAEAVNFFEVEELGESADGRGEGGFGSSGTG